MTYHSGEKQMQERAGARDLADRVGRIINRVIPPVAAAFIRARGFLAVTTVRADGAVTCSLAGGDAGFVSVTDETTLVIAPRFGQLSRMESDIDDTGIIGILAIDFATRRRMRVNGTAQRQHGTIVVTTREVYSNCPQYIHERDADHMKEGNGSSSTSSSLNDAQRSWIETADTFFIGSHHPEAGADASHRGGPSGFVRATANRVTWPDYPGNNMFNTLGNIVVNPRCGLLFVDFETGSTLQLRGRARVAGDRERVVEFDVEEVLESGRPGRSRRASRSATV